VHVLGDLLKDLDALIGVHGFDLLLEKLVEFLIAAKVVVAIRVIVGGQFGAKPVLLIWIGEHGAVGPLHDVQLAQRCGRAIGPAPKEQIRIIVVNLEIDAHLTQRLLGYRLDILTDFAGCGAVDQGELLAVLLADAIAVRVDPARFLQERFGRLRIIGPGFDVG